MHATMTRAALGALALTLAAGVPTAGAQEVRVATNAPAPSAAPDTAAHDPKTCTKPDCKHASHAKEAPAAISVVPAIQIQNLRPADRRGLNVFETKKVDDVRYEGFKLNLGAAFTQQFQGLDHQNTAQARMVNGVNQNELIRVGHGFNNAVANLYINAQVAKGVRVAMTSYLSSRHHNETWVKDGYLQIDASPIDHALLNRVMDYTTLKIGHFEINYGDQHFRRTDNGQSLYNPLVGNFILDAFTTQVGAEAYLKGRGRLDGFFLMQGMTNGEVRGMTLNPQKRSAAYVTKLGVDRQLAPALRVRLTASALNQARAANQTLYSGDRAGSRYYSMLENTLATEAANFTSGAINPGMNEMHAVVINPFVKVGGLELFGNLERARGKQPTEAARREFTQTVGEATYRFLGDALFLSGRWNQVDGRLINTTTDIGITRQQLGGGWYINPMILLKGEYVTQKYTGFAATDIRNGGKFQGFMIEAALAF